MSTKATTKTTSAAAAIIAVTMMIGVAMVLALSVIITVQEVNAQGPPAKAQAILAAEPRERGTVASGGHGGAPCDICG